MNKASPNAPSMAAGLLKVSVELGADVMCSSKLGSAVKQEDVYFNDEEDEKPEVAQPMLDYQQYYPTVLPMRPPGHEACEDEDGQEHSKPPDVAHLPVRHFPLSIDLSLSSTHCIGFGGDLTCCS